MSAHENFSKDIHKWNELDELIKKYEENIKELKKEKKKLQEHIIPYMKNEEIDICTFDDNNKVHLKTSKTKVNFMTKKALPSKLKNYFMNVENLDDTISNLKVQNIMKFLDENVEYNEKFTLTKSAPKKYFFRS